ncbi:MAG: hypothetical protein ABIK89_15310 [Planctomycetota bacterium]
MNAVRPIPGKPGYFIDVATGQEIVLTDARETDRYDTVEVAASVLSGISARKFFNSKEDKDDLDANFPSAGRLVTGSERFYLESLGLSIQGAQTSATLNAQDFKEILFHGYFTFKLNKYELEAGPMEKFPCGYGPYGATTETATSLLSIGVPSRAAVPKFLEQQIIPRTTTWTRRSRSPPAAG